MSVDAADALLPAIDYGGVWRFQVVAALLTRDERSLGELEEQSGKQMIATVNASRVRSRHG